MLIEAVIKIKNSLEYCRYINTSFYFCKFDYIIIIE